MKKRYGVVDIGTLKVKLQIVETDSSKNLKTLYDSSTLTQLGSKRHNDIFPNPEFVQKTVDELSRCKQVLQEQQVDQVRVVSTHALREMGETGQQIAQTIKDKVGFKVEIISQEEEADLFFQAVIKDFKTDEDFTIMDQGGGSVQILIGNKKKLKHTFLLKTGSATLFDRFTPHHQGTDFPSRGEIRKMTNYVLEQLQPIPSSLKTPIIYGSTCIIDIFQTLKLKLEPFSVSQSHPYKTPIKEVKDFLDKVWPIPYETREEIFHPKQRYYMWGIDKAFLNAVELAKKVQAPFVVPSNANINQGLLQSLIS